MTLKKRLNKQEQFDVIYNLTDKAYQALIKYIEEIIRFEQVGILKYLFQEEIDAMFQIRGVKTLAKILEIIPGSVSLYVDGDMVLFPEEYRNDSFVKIPHIIESNTRGKLIKKFVETEHKRSLYSGHYYRLSNPFPIFRDAPVHKYEKLSQVHKSIIEARVKETEELIRVNIQQYVEFYETIHSMVTTCKNTHELIQNFPAAKQYIPKEAPRCGALVPINQLNKANSILTDGFKIAIPVAKPIKEKRKRSTK